MLGCLVCEILMREMTNLLELALPCSTWCMFAVPPTNSLEVLRLSLVCSSLVRSFSNSPIRSLAGSFIHSFIHPFSLFFLLSLSISFLAYTKLSRHRILSNYYNPPAKSERWIATRFCLDYSCLSPLEA